MTAVKSSLVPTRILSTSFWRAPMRFSRLRIFSASFCCLSVSVCVWLYALQSTDSAAASSSSSGSWESSRQAFTDLYCWKIQEATGNLKASYTLHPVNANEDTWTYLHLSSLALSQQRQPTTHGGLGPCDESRTVQTSQERVARQGSRLHVSLPEGSVQTWSSPAMPQETPLWTAASIWTLATCASRSFLASFACAIAAAEYKRLRCTGATAAHEHCAVLFTRARHMQ